jgi:hypothetical protein
MWHPLAHQVREEIRRKDNAKVRNAMRKMVRRRRPNLWTNLEKGRSFGKKKYY